MNRPKIWLYVALLLCAGAANLVGLSRWLTHRAVAQIDRELVRGVAQVDARSQLLALEAAHGADALARDPAVLQAVSAEGDAKVASAAQAAVQSARGASADAARGQLVATSGRGGRTFSVNGAPVQADAQLEGLVSGAAADATRREGYAVVGDTLYYVVATPAGRGSAVAVGVPASGAWLSQVRSSTGADVTLVLAQRPARGTLPPSESEAVANAVRGAAGPVDVGTLPPQPLLGPGTSLASVPLLFASAPASRAHPVALRGLPGSVLALSQPTSALLAPVVSYGWIFLVGLVVLVLAGVATAFSIPNEQEMVVPKDLLAAADRITRRDFTARAPVMAGSLGTVAAALNCAAEAARSAAAAPPPEPKQPAAAETMAAPGVDAAEAPDVFAAFAASSAAAEPLAPTTHGPAGEPVAAEAAAPDLTPAQPAVAEGAPPAEPAEVVASGAEPPVSLLDSLMPGKAVEGEAGAGESPPSREETPEAAPTAPPPEAAEPAAPSLADQLAAAAQEPEPAPPPEAHPFAAAENGVLAGAAAEPPESLAASLGVAPNTVSPAEKAFEPTSPAAAAEARPAPGAEPAAAEPAPELPAEPAAAPAQDGDEEHWRVTYDEFVKVREQCGESHQGLPYERFRQKLQKNRDQLVAKYGCRTVRFQVYVKEGRAALKASPVR